VGSHHSNTKTLAISRFMPAATIGQGFISHIPVKQSLHWLGGSAAFPREAVVNFLQTLGMLTKARTSHENEQQIVPVPP
jgi:hypothetical protein